MDDKEPVGGWMVTPLSELPEEMRERLMRRRFDPNPAKVESDYDEKGW